MDKNIIANGRISIEGWRVFYKIKDETEVDITDQVDGIDYYPSMNGHFLQYYNYLSHDQAVSVAASFKALLSSDECPEIFEGISLWDIKIYLKAFSLQIDHEIREYDCTEEYN